MCGRFAIISTPDAVRKYLGYVERPHFPPRYNVAPTQPIPIVRQEDGARHFRLARWGLVPSWVKNPKTYSVLINARVESIMTKPSFRAAMKRRRCLVPADGFYEWKGKGKNRQPFFVRARDWKLLAFAGLWETWVDRDGGEIDTVTIVTCPANRTIAPIHDRMPAIVAPEHFAEWLDCEKVDAGIAAALAGPAPDDLLEAYETSSPADKAVHNGPVSIVRVRPSSAA